MQIIRMLNIENMDWLLLEKKNPLVQNLQEKSKSGSSITDKGHRPIFWVKKSSLSEDQLEYLYQFTPKVMLEHDDMLLKLEDLEPEGQVEKNERTSEAVELLRSVFSDLSFQRKQYQQDLAEIKQGLRQGNFLGDEELSEEVEQRQHQLEQKVMDLENQMGCNNEEASELALKVNAKEMQINQLQI